MRVTEWLGSFSFATASLPRLSVSTNFPRELRDQDVEALSKDVFSGGHSPSWVSSDEKV